MEEKDNKEYTVGEMVEFIKSIDIVEVLSRCEAIDENDVYGRKMLCPFHHEKTPSLSFYDNSYYCFGCAASGDTITFIQKTFDISFIQAVQLIADAYNKNLKVSSRNPFLKRNVSSRSLESEWKQYVSDLDSASDNIRDGAKIFFPLEVGYDKKINYYVFRYTSKTGMTLGFTKRRAFETDDKTRYPKWRHSNKDNTNISQCAEMYGLGPAVRHIRDEKSVILVEGPKDTIPWILEGHKNVVAISGTHNFSHAYNVLPDFNTVTLSLDSDDAGKKGMLDITKYLSDKMSLDDISYVDLGDMDPYDYYKANESIPDSKPIYDLLSDDGLKILYDVSSSFNKEKLVERYSSIHSISYDEALSFFKMGRSEHNSIKQKDDELNKLLESKDPGAIDKLRMKYGVE